jgi:transposase
MRGSEPKLSAGERFELRLYRESGMSIRQCADYFDVSQQTVYRILADFRARIGVEKLKNPRRARAHLFGHAARRNFATSQ